MSKNISAYIAGDKNIVYPAIVTLMSLKKYNNNIDCFIFTECEFLNDEQRDFCKKNNIVVEDIKDIDKQNYLSNFSDMKRWPYQIFINYLVPLYLKNKYEYDYAIKLDYDMLCVDTFNFEEIIPSKTEILSVVLKRKLSSYISKSDRKMIEQSCDFIINDNHCSTNVGTIVFDLYEYCNRKIDQCFLELYKIFLIKKFYLDDETIEQFIFGLLQSQFKLTYRDLDVSYNFRPGVVKKNQNIKIIHFSTIYKPWNILDIESAIKRTKAKNFSVISQILYFDDWISYAKSLNFKCFNARYIEYSSKELHSIFLELKDTLINTINKENILYIYIEKLLMLIPNLNYKVAKNGAYLQIFINKEKNLHYEFVFKNDSIQVALHFEKEWLNFKGILSNFGLLDCYKTIPFILNIQEGKAYYVIDDVRNYDLIVRTMHSLINKTQSFIEKNCSLSR